MPNLRNKFSHKNRPAKAQSHGNTKNSVITKSWTYTGSSLDSMHQERVLPRKRAASTGIVPRHSSQSGTNAIKTKPHSYCSPISYIDTSTSGRSVISKSPLVESPCFSSNSLLKYPCKWEAVEIRYVERDGCSRLQPTSESESASFTSQSNPAVPMFNAKESPSAAAMRKKQAEQPEVKKQTVVVEKLHVRNLLNTIREQCGDLSTSRLSEYRPAQNRTLSPSIGLPVTNDPYVVGSPSVNEESSSTVLQDSCVQYDSMDNRQVNLSYVDDASAYTHWWHENMNKNIELQSHKYCDKCSCEKHCSRFIIESCVDADIPIWGKPETCCKCHNRYLTRDQATQLNPEKYTCTTNSYCSGTTFSSDLLDAVVFCPQNHSVSCDETPRSPESIEPRKPTANTELIETIPKVPAPEPTQTDDWETSCSKSLSNNSDPPILSQEEIECYKRIALRVLLERKKLAQQRFKKRPEPVPQRHKAANRVTVDKNKLVATVRTSRPMRKPQRFLSLSNNSILRLTKRMEHFNSAEVAPADHHSEGTVLSAARIKGQIEKHKRRMSQSAKGQALRPTLHTLRRPKRRFAPPTRAKCSQINKNKPISEKSQKTIGAAWEGKSGFNFATRSTKRQNGWQGKALIPTVGSSSRPMSPLSWKLLSTMMKQEQRKYIANSKTIKCERNSFNTKRERQDKNVLMYDEFHQMMLDAAKGLDDRRFLGKVKARENTQPKKSWTVAIENVSNLRPSTSSGSFLRPQPKVFKQANYLEISKSKPNDLRIKAKRGADTSRMSNTPTPISSAKKTTPMQAVFTGDKEQLPRPMQEKNDLLSHHNHLQLEHQQQPQQKQSQERHQDKEQQSLNTSDILKSIPSQEKQASATKTIFYKKESPLYERISSLNKSSGDVPNMGFNEMLRNILKSPTARATQALGSFQEDQTVNREENDISNMTVEQIIRCYQELFSKHNSRASQNKPLTPSSPQSLCVKAESEKIHTLKASCSTHQPQASPAKASGQPKQLHSSLSNHRPCSVDDKRHLMRSASVTLGIQKKLSGFMKQTQSSLNKINVPVSKPPSPLPASKSASRNQSLEKQSEGGKAKSISKESISTNYTKAKHNSFCSASRSDVNKKDAKSLDCCATICNSHPDLGRKSTISSVLPEKPREPVIGKLLNKIKDEPVNSRVVLDGEDHPRGNKSDGKLSQIKFNSLEAVQTPSKEEFKNKNSFQRVTGVAQMEHNTSACTISSHASRTEDELMKSNTSKNQHVENTIGGAVKHVVLSSSQPSIGSNTKVASLSELSKFKDSNTVRAFSQPALQLAHTKKPPVPIPRKITRSGYPKPKNSYENLVKQKLIKRPSESNVTLHKNETKLLSKYNVPESLSNSAIRSIPSSKTDLEDLENLKEMEKKTPQKDDSQTVQAIETEQSNNLDSSFYAEISNEPRDADKDGLALKEKADSAKLRKIEAKRSLSDSKLWSRHEHLYEAYQSIAKELVGEVSTPLVQLPEPKELDKRSCAFGEVMLPASELSSLFPEKKDLNLPSTQISESKESSDIQSVTTEVLLNKYLNVDNDEQAQVSSIKSCGAVTKLATVSDGSSNEDCTNLIVPYKPPLNTSFKTTLPHALAKPRRKRIKKQPEALKIENENVDDSSSDTTESKKIELRRERHIFRDSDSLTPPVVTSPSMGDESVVKQLQDRTVANTCEMVLNQPQVSDTVTTEATESRGHSFPLGDFSEGTSHSSKQEDLFMARASPSSSQHSSRIFSSSWDDDPKNKEKSIKLQPVCNSDVKQCIIACQENATETFIARDTKDITSTIQSHEKSSKSSTSRQFFPFSEGTERTNIYDYQRIQQCLCDENDIPKYPKNIKDKNSFHSACLEPETVHSENISLDSNTKILTLKSKKLPDYQSTHCCGSTNCSLPYRSLTFRETDRFVCNYSNDDNAVDSSTRGLASGDTENSKKSDSFMGDTQTFGLSNPGVSTKAEFCYRHAAPLKARPLTSLQELRLSRVGRSIFAESRKICLDTPAINDKAMSPEYSPCHIIGESQETCCHQMDGSDSLSKNRSSDTCNPWHTLEPTADSATYTVPSETHSLESPSPDTQPFDGFPHVHHPRLTKTAIHSHYSHTLKTCQYGEPDFQNLSEIHSLKPDSSTKDFTSSLRNMNVPRLGSSTSTRKGEEFSSESAMEKTPYWVSSGTQTSSPELAVDCADNERQTSTPCEPVIGSDSENQRLQKPLLVDHPEQLTKEVSANTPLVTSDVSVKCCESQKQSSNSPPPDNAIPSLHCDDQQEKCTKFDHDHSVSNLVTKQTSTTELNPVINTGTSISIELLSPPKPKNEHLEKNTSFDSSHALQQTPGRSKSIQVTLPEVGKETCEENRCAPKQESSSNTKTVQYTEDQMKDASSSPICSIGAIGCSSPKRPLSRNKSNQEGYHMIEKRVWENLELFIESVKKDSSVKQPATLHLKETECFSLSAPPNFWRSINTTGNMLPENVPKVSSKYSQTVVKRSFSDLHELKNRQLTLPNIPDNRKVDESRTTGDAVMCCAQEQTFTQNRFPSSTLDQSKFKQYHQNKPNKEDFISIPTMSPINSTDSMSKIETKHSNVFSTLSPPKRSQISTSPPIQSPLNLTCSTTKTPQSPCLGEELLSMYRANVCSFKSPYIPGMHITDAPCLLNRSLKHTRSTDWSARPLPYYQTYSSCPSRLSYLHSVACARNVTSPINDTSQDLCQNITSPESSWVGNRQEQGSYPKQSLVLTEEDILFLMKISNGKEPLCKDSVSGILSLDVSNISKVPTPNENENLMLFTEDILTSSESHCDDDSIFRCVREDCKIKGRAVMGQLPSHHVRENSSLGDSQVPLMSNTKRSNEYQTSSNAFDSDSSISNSPVHKKGKRTKNYRGPDNCKSASSTLSKDFSKSFSYSRQINSDELLFCSKFRDPISKEMKKISERVVNKSCHQGTPTRNDHHKSLFHSKAVNILKQMIFKNLFEASSACLQNKSRPMAGISRTTSIWDTINLVTSKIFELIGKKYRSKRRSKSRKRRVIFNRKGCVKLQNDMLCVTSKYPKSTINTLIGRSGGCHLKRQKNQQLSTYLLTKERPKSYKMQAECTTQTKGGPNSSEAHCSKLPRELGQQKHIDLKKKVCKDASITMEQDFSQNLASGTSENVRAEPVKTHVSAMGSAGSTRTVEVECNLGEEEENVTRKYGLPVQASAEKTTTSEMEHMRSTFSIGNDPGENSSLNANQIPENDNEIDLKIGQSLKVTFTDSVGNIQSLCTKRTVAKEQSPVTCFSSRLSFLENISATGDHIRTVSDTSLSFTDDSVKSLSSRNQGTKSTSDLDSESIPNIIELPQDEKQTIANAESEDEQLWSVLPLTAYIEKNCPVQTMSDQKENCSELSEPQNVPLITLLTNETFPVEEAPQFSPNIPRLLSFTYKLMLTSLNVDIPLNLAPYSDLCIVDNKTDTPEKKAPRTDKTPQVKYEKQTKAESRHRLFIDSDLKNNVTEDEEEIPQIKTRGYRKLEILQEESDCGSVGDDCMNNKGTGQYYGEPQDDKQILDACVQIILLPPTDNEGGFLEEIFAGKNHEASSLSYETGRGVLDKRKNVSFLEHTNCPDRIGENRKLEERYSFLPYTTECTSPPAFYYPTTELGSPPAFCYPKNVIILDEKYSSETGQFIHPDGNIIFCPGRDPDKSSFNHNTEKVPTEQVHRKPEKKLKNPPSGQRTESQIIENRKKSPPQQKYCNSPNIRRKDYSLDPVPSSMSIPHNKKCKSNIEESMSPDWHNRSSMWRKHKHRGRHEQTSWLRSNPIRTSSSYESFTNTNKGKRRWYQRPGREHTLSTPNLSPELRHGWWHIPTSPAAKPRCHGAPQTSLDNFDVDTYDDLGSFVTEMQDTTTSSSRTWDAGFTYESSWEERCVKTSSVTFTRSSSDLVRQAHLAQCLLRTSSPCSPCPSSTLLEPFVQINAYVDNSTQVHSTLYRNSAPLRCQGEQTDFVEQTSDKCIQANPCTTFDREDAVYKELGDQTHEKPASPPAISTDKTECHDPSTGMAVPHQETFACSVLQDFMRLSLTNFVENLVESKLKKQTNTIACQNDETCEERCSNSDKNDTSNESSSKQQKSSLEATTEQTTASGHKSQAAGIEICSNTTHTVQTSSSEEAKKDAKSETLATVPNEDIPPPTQPVELGCDQTNCSLKRFKQSSFLTSSVASSDALYRDSQHQLPEKVDSSTSNSRKLEKVSVSEVTGSRKSAQDQIYFKEVNSKLSSVPLRSCHSFESIRPHISQTNQSCLCNQRTPEEKASLTKYKLHSIPLSVSQMKLDRFDKSLDGKNLLSLRKVYSSIDLSMDSSVYSKAAQETFVHKPTGSDKTENSKPVLQFHSSYLKNLEEKITQKAQRVSPPHKLSFTNSKQKESACATKDSTCEVGNLSSSSSSLVDYGGLRYVLSRESKDLWKQLTNLERSYESCELCKKQYKKTTGRSLSPQWIRPRVVHQSRPCRIHKPTKPFQRSASAQISKSSAKTGREYTNSVLRPISNSSKTEDFAQTDSENNADSSACEKVFEAMDKPRLKAVGPDKKKQKSICTNIWRSSTKGGDQLTMQTATPNQLDLRTLTKVETNPTNSRSDLKRRLNFPLHEDGIPPIKKASQSSCCSVNNMDTKWSLYSKGKVIGGAYRRSGTFRCGKTARMVQLFERSSCSSGQSSSCGSNLVKPTSPHSESSGRSNNASCCYPMEYPTTKTNLSSEAAFEDNVKYDSIHNMAIFHTIMGSTGLCRGVTADPHVKPCNSWTNQTGQEKDGDSNSDTLPDCKGHHKNRMAGEFPLQPSTRANEERNMIMIGTSPTQRDCLKQQEIKIGDHEVLYHPASPDADQCIKTLGNILCQMRNTFPEDRMMQQANSPEKSDLVKAGPDAEITGLFRQNTFNCSDKYTKSNIEKSNESLGDDSVNMPALINNKKLRQKSHTLDKAKDCLTDDFPIPIEDAVQSEVELLEPQPAYHDSVLATAPSVHDFSANHHGMSLNDRFDHVKHYEDKFKSRSICYNGNEYTEINPTDHVKNVLDHIRVEHSEKEFGSGSTCFTSGENKMNKKEAFYVAQKYNNINNVSRKRSRSRKRRCDKSPNRISSVCGNNTMDSRNFLSYKDENFSKEGILFDNKVMNQSHVFQNTGKHSLAAKRHNPFCDTKKSCDAKRPDSLELNFPGSRDETTVGSDVELVSQSSYGMNGLQHCDGEDITNYVADTIVSAKTIEKEQVKKNTIENDESVNNHLHCSFLKNEDCKGMLDASKYYLAGSERQEKVLGEIMPSFDTLYPEEVERLFMPKNNSEKTDVCDIVVPQDRTSQKYTNMSNVSDSSSDAVPSHSSLASSFSRYHAGESKACGFSKSQVTHQNSPKPQVGEDLFKTSTLRYKNVQEKGININESKKVIHSFCDKNPSEQLGNQVLFKSVQGVKDATHVMKTPSLYLPILYWTLACRK
ncbi:hypothetical protein EGW08_019074 [Elysia chlorotica]|uniref:Uncharacterized protein n=1 Tax=Elysia chlorotica TaxID=188477 RepID=A0A3S1B246_ELYCH|nr:hypothetical protein EGW08_019074 [Elysia chlorotica]